jgi:hypothetical protein
VDRVAQQPDSLDLDFTYVAGLHEQLWVSFKALAVSACWTICPFSRVVSCSPEPPAGTSSAVTRNGPKAPGAVEVLADGPLRSLHLEVAHRSIVEDRVADDVLQGITLGDVAAARSDDRNQFAPVFELFGHPGADKWGLVPGETGREQVSL